MNKIICIILCWTFTAAFAEIPSWHPENMQEIRDKCMEETQLPISIQEAVKKGPVDDPKVHEFLLCLLKGFNVYNEDTGLNVDRLIYSMYQSQNKLNSKKPLVQDCVDNNKEAASDGEMVFKVITCIITKEDERMKQRPNFL